MRPLAALARAGLGAALLLAPALGGCGHSSSGVSDREAVPYTPNRWDYTAFLDRQSAVIDPNYLPFMLHRVAVAEPPGDLLFFCRWADEDLPLAVYIEPPDVPESLQDEFRPVDPREYVLAVTRALASWERELEGRVAFVRKSSREEAALTLRLRGESAPMPEADVQVLGSTEALLDACTIEGAVGPGTDPVPVRFRVPELSIYVADRAGLLTAHQVERIALHEIGHALGMRGHSPLATDMMFPVVRDRPGVDELSMEDANSFLSLYAVPNGTRYAFVPEGWTLREHEPVPPTPLPLPAVAPHVDARHGYRIKPPAGWIRTSTDRGFFAANGPIWDRDASFEVVVWPYPTIETFLQRFSRMLFAGTELLGQAPVVVAGRPTLWIAVLDDTRRRRQEFLFVELGDGRLMMVLTDSPEHTAALWRPWFQSVLGTLEIWEEPGAGLDSSEPAEGAE